MSLIVIAHNIRSLHNVGAIFRSAAAFGIEKLYLTGYTATPPRKEIAKVALGAERLVAWEAGEINAVIAQLKSLGYSICALETGADAIALADAPKGNIALVLGSEVEGIDADTLARCDHKLVIAMSAKQSLNVSVAAGVAMYQLTRL